MKRLAPLLIASALAVGGSAVGCSVGSGSEQGQVEGAFTANTDWYQRAAFRCAEHLFYWRLPVSAAPNTDLEECKQFGDYFNQAVYLTVNGDAYAQPTGDNWSDDAVRVGPSNGILAAIYSHRNLQVGNSKWLESNRLSADGGYIIVMDRKQISGNLLVQLAHAVSDNGALWKAICKGAQEGAREISSDITFCANGDAKPEDFTNEQLAEAINKALDVTATGQDLETVHGPRITNILLALFAGKKALVEYRGEIGAAAKQLTNIETQPWKYQAVALANDDATRNLFITPDFTAAKEVAVTAKRVQHGIFGGNTDYAFVGGMITKPNCGKADRAPIAGSDMGAGDAGPGDTGDAGGFN